MRKLLYLLTFFFTIHQIQAQDPTFTFPVYSSHKNDFLNYTSNYETIFEGCTDINIRISRPIGFSDSEINLPITLSGSAVINNDYTVSYGTNSIEVSDESSTIVIPVSSPYVDLLITPVHDGVVEGTETIILTIDEIVIPGSFQTSSESYSFSVKDQPNLSLTVSSSATSVHCPGDEVILDAQLTGGVGQYMRSPFIQYQPYSYVWEQIGTDPTQPVNPQKTTDYVVRATDICGTQFVSKSVNIEVPIYPDFDATTSPAYVCEQDAETDLCVSDLYGGEGTSYTYNWSSTSNTSTLSSSQCLTAGKGDYKVSISDVCNTSPLVLQNTIYLDAPPVPFFEYLVVPNSELILEFNNYTVDTTDVSFKYRWDYGNGQVSNQEEAIFPRYDVPGTYEVSLKTVSDMSGCVNEHIEYAYIDRYYFYAPNAFTPNGDDVNDSFRPIVTGTKSYELFVYDGFGKVVFNTSELTDEWDGTYKGKPAAEGVYIFKVVMVKEADVVVFSEQGTVTLLR